MKESYHITISKLQNKTKKQVSSLILRTKLKTKQILKHQSVDQRKTLECTGA